MPRLDHLLARNLSTSRTAVRELMEAGSITDLDGSPLSNPRMEISAASLPLEVLVEGASLELHAEAHFLLNKPAGYITALEDDRYPTAYSLLEGAPLFGELRAVGRLDVETTGLLLWTTDGQWLQRLTHPKRAVKRTYQAALARPFASLPPEGLVLADGHRPTVLGLAELKREAAHPSLLLPPEATHLAEITVAGGAYHEVRRIFAALGSHVLGLCRVSFGRYQLPAELTPGGYEPVSPEVAGDHGSVPA